MIIEWTASKTAKWTKKTSPENTASFEVLNYGFRLFYNTLAIILLSLIYGLIFNQLLSMTVSLFSFALLRFFSGGRHVDSSDHCVMISVGLMILITQLSYYSDDWQNELGCLSLLLILVFAPYNIESQVKIFKDKFYVLKFISCVVIASNLFIFESNVVSWSFLIQSITLIRWSDKG